MESTNSTKPIEMSNNNIVDNADITENAENNGINEDNGNAERKRLDPPSDPPSSFHPFHHNDHLDHLDEEEYATLISRQSWHSRPSHPTRPSRQIGQNRQNRQYRNLGPFPGGGGGYGGEYGSGGGGGGGGFSLSGIISRVNEMEERWGNALIRMLTGSNGSNTPRADSSTSSTSNTRTSGGNGGGNGGHGGHGGGSGFSTRQMLLLFILSGIVGMLVIIASNAERSIETEAVTETSLAHHSDSSHSSLSLDKNDPLTKKVLEELEKEKQEQQEQQGERDGTLDSDSNGQETPQSTQISQSQQSPQSQQSQQSLQAPQTDSNNSNNSNASNNQNHRNYIGFHEPSIESYTHPNIYRKPKGVGYPLAPKGGLHPVYIDDIYDLTDNASTQGNQGNQGNGGNDGFDGNGGYGGWKVEGERYDQFQGEKFNSPNSPYADPRLKLSDEERRREQEEWREKLEGIRREWGYWNFVDPRGGSDGGGSGRSDGGGSGEQSERPVVDYETVRDGTFRISGELDKGDFPTGVWQGDDEYITNFLTEAKSLITRVQEAIYAEYGFATSTLTPEQLTLRSQQFGVVLLDEDQPKNPSPNDGVAWMYKSSMEALVKKLLNGMMTNDHFFVILGGHSAAAGHGNNFHQSYMMQFQEVMEPVFDRLGMVLVSANRAQGGMGTVQAALAGGGVYGEKDVMVWDSSMTEKAQGPQDLFYRQMLLTGHRVPILLDFGGGKADLDTLHKTVGAHVGGLTTGTPSFMKQTTDDLAEVEKLPFALQHLFCAKGVNSCNEAGHKYNAKCWVERNDVDPPTTQNTGYGGQASWHPGNRVHQWTARKLTLLFLEAFQRAISTWETAVKTSGNPLDPIHWHLTQEENEIRDNVMKMDVTTTECGKWLELIPRVCNTPMKGGTLWTPRADPEHLSIMGFLKPAPNGYLPAAIDPPKQVYTGKEVHFPSQRVPKGEVDVAAIARSLPPQSRRTRRDDDQLQRMLSVADQKPGHNYVSTIERAIVQNSTAAPHPNNFPRTHLKLQPRQLQTSSIAPGEGWTVINHPLGYCDGTLNSVCYRDPSHDCLMSGHNDARGLLFGDGLSGWLVFKLTNVKHGIFMARTETWHQPNSNARTEGWTEENNGRKDGRRGLKAPPPPPPDDWALEFAVNGVIQYKWDLEDLRSHAKEVTYNVAPFVFWDDVNWALERKEEDVEVALRLAGGGRAAVIAFSHIYYA